MEYSTTNSVSYTIDSSYCSSIVKQKIYKYSCYDNTYDYKIFTNDSAMICDDDEQNRIYRSVILNHKDQLMCFSPPNAVSVERFMANNPDITKNVYLNAIMEGTMINLFYDPDLQNWEISTRGSIGGHYWYFRNEYVLNDRENLTGENQPSENLPGESIRQSEQITFRNMFLDALRSDRDSKINDNVLIRTFDTNHCYSFVLQHPSNHIVLPITQPQLFLVAVYNIKDNIAKPVPPFIYENWSSLTDIRGIIEFPPSIIESTYDAVKDKYCSIQSSFRIMGVMLYNPVTGLRAAMQNPVYEDLKKLRGNNPNLQYQFFCLLNVNKCDLFLAYFPMYRKLFKQFNSQYQDFITNVHQSYFSYYVKKDRVQIAKKYFIHVSRIHHQIFIPAIASGEKVIINRNTVKKYFEGLTPSELLYYLNYDKRQSSKIQQTLCEETGESVSV